MPSSATASTPEIQETPLPIPGLKGMTGVVAGGNFSCAMVSGAVECWGYNGDGELGNGTYGGGTPQTVSLNSPVAVGAGYQHSCAVLSNGTAQCWGRNVEGQLGNGTMTTNSPAPTPVSELGGATAIALGWDHTCALLSNRSVECGAPTTTVSLAMAQPLAAPRCRSRSRA